MMYGGVPRHARRMIKSTLVSAWLLSGAAGLSITIVAASGNAVLFPAAWSVAFGGMLAVGASIAALGVAVGRYRWEWVSSWLASAAVAPYAALAWASTFLESWQNVTTALLFTSLVMFFINRGALCAAHASKLRKVHREGTAVLETIKDERDGGDGVSDMGGN